MKKKNKKFSVSKNTVRKLSDIDSKNIVGASRSLGYSFSCE